MSEACCEGAARAAILTLLLACACASGGPPASSNVFRDESVGFELTKPEGWHWFTAEHGDAMCADKMARTEAQRRFDALHAMCLAAASGDAAGGAGPAVMVNVVIGEERFEHALEEMLDGEPEPLDAALLARIEALGPRLVITPHIGGFTFESLEAVEEFMADTFLAAYRALA